MEQAKDQTYNGWANWETWNVALWFGNDQALYNRVRVHAQKYGRFNAQAAKTFVQLALPRGTPDFKSAASSARKPIERFTREAYAHVDWKAIADDFNEMGE